LDDEGSKFEYYFLIILAKQKKRNTSEGIPNFQKKFPLERPVPFGFPPEKSFSMQ